MPKKKGICHICGKKGDLTFEHIPPKATGNIVKSETYLGSEFLHKHFNNEDLKGVKYEIHQQGSGDYTLCSECNSYTGSKYGEAYSEIINQIKYELQNTDLGIYNTSKIKFEKFNALAFFKQCISFFCSLVQPGSMEDCKEFLLDCDNTFFNRDKYMLSIALLPQKPEYSMSIAWHQRICGNGNFATLAQYIDHPVCMFLYRIDKPIEEMIGCDIPSCNITALSDIPYGKRIRVEIILPHIEFDSKIRVRQKF